MEKLISFIMYILWIVTILMVLAATFTKFEHDDLNMIALLLFMFASLNSFFILSRKR